jgi:hypothetical protein
MCVTNSITDRISATDGAACSKHRTTVIMILQARFHNTLPLVPTYFSKSPNIKFHKIPFCDRRIVRRGRDDG